MNDSTLADALFTLLCLGAVMTLATGFQRLLDRFRRDEPSSVVHLDERRSPSNVTRLPAPRAAHQQENR